MRASSSRLLTTLTQSCLRFRVIPASLTTLLNTQPSFFAPTSITQKFRMFADDAKQMASQDRSDEEHSDDESSDLSDGESPPIDLESDDEVGVSHSDSDSSGSDSSDEESSMPAAGMGRDKEYSIWVGNIPFHLEESRVEEFFEDCGDIKSVRIIKREGVSKGFGYVNFYDEEARDEALKYNGRNLDGRDLYVKTAIKFDRPTGSHRSSNQGGFEGSRRPSSTEPNSSLFIGQLSYDSNEKDLENAFGKHRDHIQKIRISFDRETGRSRGFAHVDFDSKESAEAALRDVNGLELDGRNLRLDFARGFASSGGRGGYSGEFAGEREGRSDGYAGNRASGRSYGDQRQRDLEGGFGGRPDSGLGFNQRGRRDRTEDHEDY